MLTLEMLGVIAGVSYGCKADSFEEDALHAAIRGGYVLRVADKLFLSGSGLHEEQLARAAVARQIEATAR